MGLSVFPAPAAGKTAYRLTLLSGTSWTVPAGVTYVNVTLTGGGGAGCSNTIDAVTATGGTTTFTGATSATGGHGNVMVRNGINPSVAGTGAYGEAGQHAYLGVSGPDRPTQVVRANTVSSLVTGLTPGGTVSYTIGAGGVAPTSANWQGGNGGPGKIDIEYWA